MKVLCELVEMWVYFCLVQVYEVGDVDGDGIVEVKLVFLNCV